MSCTGRWFEARRQESVEECARTVSRECSLASRQWGLRLQRYGSLGFCRQLDAVLWSVGFQMLS
eukprot:7173268-Pyramimonas_sp.AAC.1